MTWNPPGEYWNNRAYNIKLEKQHAAVSRIDECNVYLFQNCQREAADKVSIRAFHGAPFVFWFVVHYSRWTPTLLINTIWEPVPSYELYWYIGEFVVPVLIW